MSVSPYHRALRPRLLVLSALTVLFALVALTLGRYPLGIEDLLSGLNPLTDTLTQGAQIVRDLRLPRVLTALLVGSALALAGTAFQSLFANPLAAPDTLGLATGSAFGAILGLSLKGEVWAVQALALLGGLAAMAMVLAVTGAQRQRGLLPLILAGMVTAALFTALITLLKILSDPQDELPGLIYWMMGSLTGASWTSLSMGAIPLVFGALWLWRYRWTLNLLALPEDEARSLGVNVTAARRSVIVAATLLTACSVSMTGLIGWIGLIMPHAARAWIGADTRRVLPMSALLGGLFLLVADTLARTITTAELPVAVITSLVGAPLFLWLLRRQGGAA